MINLKKVCGRTKGMKVSDLVSKASALSISTLALSTIAITPSIAATSGGQIASNISSQFNSFGGLLINACYLGGIGLAGAGLLEMKKAGNDNNQGRDGSYKGGLIKIGAGGGLCVVPSIAGVGIGTIFNGGNGDGAPSQSNLSFTGG